MRPHKMSHRTNSSRPLIWLQTAFLLVVTLLCAGCADEAAKDYVNEKSGTINVQLPDHVDSASKAGMTFAYWRKAAGLVAICSDPTILKEQRRHFADQVLKDLANANADSNSDIETIISNASLIARNGNLGPAVVKAIRMLPTASVDPIAIKAIKAVSHNLEQTQEIQNAINVQYAKTAFKVASALDGNIDIVITDLSAPDVDPDIIANDGLKTFIDVAGNVDIKGLQGAQAARQAIVASENKMNRVLASDRTVLSAKYGLAFPTFSLFNREGNVGSCLPMLF